jgi:hypothetical protein
MSSKFFIAFCFVFLALLLQFSLGETSGVWISFTLAALITASFFTDFLELFALTLTAVFVLNWQPVISYELLVIGSLPLAIFFARKLVPFKAWLSNLTMILVAIVIFYASFGIRPVPASRAIFLWDICLSLIFGTAICEVMQFV